MSQLTTGGRLTLDAARSCEQDDVLYEVGHELAPGVHLDLLTRRNPRAAGMLVLLPSAQARRTRTNPIYHRWSWGANFPERHLVVLSDPSLYVDEELLGGWYMDPEHDLVAATSAVLRSLAESWGVSTQDVVLYGSSMGGFLAMMMAAHLPGASAIAEIPQFDMRDYEFPSTIRTIERCLLGGRGMDDHFDRHPEQVSVIERFRLLGHVPSLTILTNITDTSFQGAQALLTEISQDRQLKQHFGPLRIDVVPEQPGHAALTFGQVRPVIAGVLAAAESRSLATELGGTGDAFDDIGSSPLCGLLYPGYSSLPGLTLQVTEHVAHLRSTLSDGHRYIWGPRQDWSASRGPFVIEMLTDRTAPLLLAVAYFDAQDRQIACHFLKPGEPQPHDVPGDARSVAVGLRVSGPTTCRLRLRRGESTPDVS